MPPVIGIVIGAIVAAGSAIGAAAGAIGWATAISLIATGGLLIISAFTRPSIAIDGQKVASQSPDADRVIVYGQAMVGGTISYIAAVGSESTRLHLVVTIAATEITSIDAIYFDNYKLQLAWGRDGFSGQMVWQETYQYQNKVYVEMKFGAPGEAAFPALIAETVGLGDAAQSWQASFSYSPGDLIQDSNGFLQVCVTGGTSYTSPPNPWNDELEGETAELPPSTVVWQCLGKGIGSSAWTPAHRQDGCASVHLMLKYDQQLFASGLPQFRFLVSGKKVYDPRTDTVGWSDNPALCIRDFLLDPKFGYRCFTTDNGATSREINDDSFIAAANLCDESVTTTGYPRQETAGPFASFQELDADRGFFDWSNRKLYWIESVTDLGSGVGPSGASHLFTSVINVLDLDLLTITQVPVGAGLGPFDHLPGGLAGGPNGWLVTDGDGGFYLGGASGYGGWRWYHVTGSGVLTAFVGYLSPVSCGAGSTGGFPRDAKPIAGQVLHVDGSGAVWLISTEGGTSDVIYPVSPGTGLDCTELPTGGDCNCYQELGSTQIATLGLGTTDLASIAVVSSTEAWILAANSTATTLTKVDTATGIVATVSLPSTGSSVAHLEYCQADESLLYWVGSDNILYKWDIATQAVIASRSGVPFDGSGPIIENMLPNGLGLINATTLEDGPVTGAGLNPSLPAYDDAYGFGHYYDPSTGRMFLQAGSAGDSSLAVYAAGLGSTNVPRYTLDGSYDTSKSIGEVLQSLLSSCSGKVTSISGQWNLFVGAWRPPTLSPFTDDDLRGAVQVQAKQSRRDIYTGVKGQYIEPANNWMPTDFPPAVRSDYVALQNGTCETPNDRGDWVTGRGYAVNDTVISFGYAYVCTSAHTSDPTTQPGLGDDWPDDWIFAGEIIWKDVQFPFTIIGATAQRLARIDLEWGWRQITATLSLKLQGYKAIPADTIELTRPTFAWTAKTFEITASKLVLGGSSNGAPELGVDLTLHETDEDVYAWSTDDEQQIPGVQTIVPGPPQTFDTGGDTWRLDPGDS